MAIKKKLIDSEKLSQVVVAGMQEKKAIDVLVMDLRGIKSALADYFILCTGNSDTQIEAISESVEFFVSEKANQNVWHKEGFKNKEWILLDYVDVVVNVFKKETREFYNLEQMWGDAIITSIESSYPIEQ